LGSREEIVKKVLSYGDLAPVDLTAINPMGVTNDFTVLERRLITMVGFEREWKPTISLPDYLEQALGVAPQEARTEL
jgi:hypothetical protein